MAGIPFDRALRFEYGKAASAGEGVQRIVARNGGPFTFHGTGTFIVGDRQVAVIDPGPDDEAHLQALLDALQGRTVTHILVTHTHPDHSPGAAALSAATGAPTCGFGPHAQGRTDPLMLSGGGADLAFRPTLQLADGDVVQGDGWALRALHTPGHCSNHLCFELVGERLLFSGDHVMGWSTTVVAPPDGDMGAYVHSLERLLSRDDARYLPAHGGAIEDPQTFVRALIDHRRAREAQILRALGAGPRTIPAMVAEMYRDVPAVLHHAAARSVLAHLVDLHQRERVRCTDRPAPGLDGCYILH